MKKRFEVDVTSITTYIVECDSEGDALKECFEGRVVGDPEGVTETVDMQVNEVAE